ncbi:alpha/beta hydrolase [Actinorugispora endophytica]|uniref:alpha/beta hydrolase n=1 Tax=Actinorugispora endophytica TaxID=1605990 RepID=UPI001FB5B8DA|nr:alpha/beta hydrolase-fold protein [Actinorugispora endophytica]
MGKSSALTATLAVASLTVMAACVVAVAEDRATDANAVTESAGESAATDPDRVRPLLGQVGLLPRPYDVPVCREPGTDEIIEVPDKGAPDDTRAIWVRRPPGPDSADRPVLYLLHGSTGTHRWLRDADVGPLLDEEMCRSGVEFVIAAPYGQEEMARDTEWGDSVDGSFKIETFVTDKAIEAVEGDNPRPRALRAIGGFSMGGYGAAALSLRHPDDYAQVVSWAGYFKVDDPSGTFGDNPDPHAPDQLLDGPRARDIRFMLIEGTEDETPLQEGVIGGEAERFAALLAERGIEHTTLFPPGGHTMDAWRPTFPDAVDFLVEGWRAPAGPEDA